MTQTRVYYTVPRFQCEGRTRAGARCNRRGRPKINLRMARVYGLSYDESHWRCWQHPYRPLCFSRHA